MTSKSNYTRSPQQSQDRNRGQRPGTRASLLAQGARGPVLHLRVVYLATPIDQFHHPHYRTARNLVAVRFPPGEWAIFEPARVTGQRSLGYRSGRACSAGLMRSLFGHVGDGSVGSGVFVEASRRQAQLKPVYVLEADRLKIFRGFRRLKGGTVRYAQVLSGRILRPGSHLKGGA